LPEHGRKSVARAVLRLVLARADVFRVPMEREEVSFQFATMNPA